MKDLLRSIISNMRPEARENFDPARLKEMIDELSIATGISSETIAESINAAAFGEAQKREKISAHLLREKFEDFSAVHVPRKETSFASIAKSFDFEIHEGETVSIIGEAKLSGIVKGKSINPADGSISIIVSITGSELEITVPLKFVEKIDPIRRITSQMIDLSDNRRPNGMEDFNLPFCIVSDEFPIILSFYPNMEQALEARKAKEAALRSAGYDIQVSAVSKELAIKQGYQIVR